MNRTEQLDWIKANYQQKDITYFAMTAWNQLVDQGCSDSFRKFAAALRLYDHGAVHILTDDEVDCLYRGMVERQK